MSDYLNKSSTYDSAEVIAQASAEIRRRVKACAPGPEQTAHPQAVQEELTAYLRDLEQRSLISGTIFNYLDAVLFTELERVRVAPEAAAE